MRFRSLVLAFVLPLLACAPDAPTKDGVNDPLPETPPADLVEEPEAESGDAGELLVELLGRYVLAFQADIRQARKP